MDGQLGVELPVPVVLRVQLLQHVGQQAEGRHHGRVHHLGVEQQPEVHDAVGRRVEVQHPYALDVVLGHEQVGGGGLQVGQGQHRDGGQLLGRVRFGLPGQQVRGLGHERLDLLALHLLAFVGQLGLELGGHPGLEPLLGNHHRGHPVGVVDQVLLHQVLEHWIFERAADLGQGRLVGHAEERVVGEHPGPGAEVGVDQALGERAEVGLAQGELGAVDHALDDPLVEPVRAHLRQGRLDQLDEPLLVVGVGALDRDLEHALLAVVEVRGHVLADARVLDGLPQGCAGPVDQHVGQHLHGQRLGGLGRAGRHPGHGQVGLVRRILLLADRVGGAHAAGRVEQRLVRPLDGGLGPAELDEVLLVDELQLGQGVAVAPQGDVAVARVVQGALEVQQLLARQLRDRRGIPARRQAIGRVREQRPADLVVEDPRGRGERALHLVVHDAVEDQGRVRVGELVAPALLQEDARIVVDGGVQHRVEVHVDEVEEVLGVGRRHRVHGEVRRGHGVEEGVERAARQHLEGALDRELARPVQHRVLQDVGDPGVAVGWRHEGEAEALVVVVGDVLDQLRAAARVLEAQGQRVDLGDLALLHQLEAVVGLADRPLGVGGRGEQQRQQQGEGGHPGSDLGHGSLPSPRRRGPAQLSAGVRGGSTDDPVRRSPTRCRPPWLAWPDAVDRIASHHQGGLR